ncbi:bacterial regulatory helix-turn-helix s, AraC family protein, partial [Vibrio parahaemolyticus V-223/04]
KRTLNKS